MCDPNLILRSKKRRSGEAEGLVRVLIEQRRSLLGWATIMTIIHYIAEETERGYIAMHSPGPNRNPKLIRRRN